MEIKKEADKTTVDLGDGYLYLFKGGEKTHFDQVLAPNEAFVREWASCKVLKNAPKPAPKTSAPEAPKAPVAPKAPEAPKTDPVKKTEKPAPKSKPKGKKK